MCRCTSLIKYIDVIDENIEDEILIKQSIKPIKIITLARWE
nr:hypothetical protein [Mycoplasmopsis bovis]